MVKGTKLQYFFSILLIILIGLFIYSLWERQPHADDGWIGEYTYWLAEDGYVHSELMRGVTSQEERFIVHHKLLNLNGALFIKIFGFSIYTLKSVSLVYFIIFLIIFYTFTKRKDIFNYKEFLLALIMIFSFTLLFEFSFVYRPEMMIMCLTFISFIFLDRAKDTHERIGIYTFLAGLFGGLAIATHLNGLATAAAGFFFLLWYKKWKGSFIYIVGVLLASTIYFYDFTKEYGFAYWLYQLTKSPSVSDPSEHSVFIYILKNLVNEHLRYFHNLEITVFSIFMLVTLIVGFKYLKTNFKNILRYLLLLVIFLAMVAVHKTSKYMLVCFPFFVIIITKIFYKFLNDDFASISLLKQKWIRLSIIILFSCYFLSGLYHNFRFSTEKFNAQENRYITEKYIDRDPSEVNIIAPLMIK